METTQWCDMGWNVWGWGFGSVAGDAQWCDMGWYVTWWGCLGVRDPADGYPVYELCEDFYYKIDVEYPVSTEYPRFEVTDNKVLRITGGQVEELVLKQEFGTYTLVVGPDKQCPPRHRMPFNSRNEGLQRV